MWCWVTRQWMSFMMLKQIDWLFLAYREDRLDCRKINRTEPFIFFVTKWRKNVSNATKKPPHIWPSFGVGVWLGRYSTLLLIFHASYFSTTLSPCLHLDCVRSNLETCAKNRVPSQWPMHQASAVAGLPSNSLLCYFTASKQAFFSVKKMVLCLYHTVTKVCLINFCVCIMAWCKHYMPKNMSLTEMVAS